MRPVRTAYPGRVAIVTGAAQGIGAAVTRLLAEAGITVAAIDVQAEALAQQVAMLVAQDLPVRAWPVDLCDASAIDAAVDRIETQLGPVDMLAHVAGALRLGRVADVTVDDWLHCFAVNTHAAFHVSRAVVRHMRPRRRGSIVAVGSNAATVPRIEMAAYAASKAALHQFMRCLGLELAGEGIRCNTVAPGSTDTPMQRQLVADEAAARRVIAGVPATYRTGIPLGRIASPHDVAQAVAFLLSDAAGHITLQTLTVDGGATLGA